MAKKTKEAGLPVLIALVFFVLITIGLGVFCYVQYSDQEANVAALKKEQDKSKADAKLAKDAENKAKVYRIVLGIDEPSDKETLLAESKPGDLNVQELKKINDALAKRLAQVSTAVADKDKVKFAPVTIKDILVWAPDADNRLPPAPTKVIVDGAVQAYADREVVKAEAEGKVKEYTVSQTNLKQASDKYDVGTKALAANTTDNTQKLEKLLKDIKDAADKRQKAYEAETKQLREKIDGAEQQNTKITAELAQANQKVNDLKFELTGLSERQKKVDQFAYDAPLGKILRKLPDNTVEIDIGSTDKARAGLTFSVLPADFPARGYQSRVQTFREADERGHFRDVRRFVEKANIEIIEVLGPNSSKARIIPGSENAVRDAVLTGDLLYNAVWKRGYVDHVALYGIFDTNGDGTDDIQSVVRDFLKMGIPVDAYWDMKAKDGKGDWVGKLSSRTRYAIEGFQPTSSAADPFKDAKQVLIGGMSNARNEAKEKGAVVVSFRDIFPRMGYKVRLDVTDDKINQATSQYLKGLVPAADPAAAPPANN